ncbi:MAG TPA: hypothetical protein VH643_41615 [Gemmataceae bacterium]|jgi:hypothetical protein
MVQTCSKCSRANPSDAVYCYFDGFVLGGHSRNGGPVAVGAQAFANPFVFPGGRQCRNFDELAVACQDEWSSARDLLKKGYLETFFGGLGRVDLALAAKESAKFPDPDLGLNQLLDKLPSDVLAEPELALETQEFNLGTLPIGSEREFQLRMENRGMRLISGTVTSADAPWLALGDAAGNQKHFQFQHDFALPIRVRPDKLRANNKPLEANLEVESNGGSFIVAVKAQVPVKPFPSGALAGAKSPRQAAEKAKANSKEAALLFENGAVAEWYKSNGWTYPVQGPAASGLGAVQQFFEALGLTAPPKVEISTNRIDLTGTPGEQLRANIEIKSQEKRPVYAHATSNQPWLEVSRAKLNGRVASINLSVPAVPNKEGETLTAKLIVQSNGNQRFVVPVSLQIGNNLVFGDPTPLPVVESVSKTPSAPALIVPPIVSSRRSGEYRRRRAKGTPAWVHALPALLLLLVMLVAVLVDHLLKPAAVANRDTDIEEQEKKAPVDPWSYNLKDADPLLSALSRDQDERFGLVMTKSKDPNYADKYKRLTYDDHGASNNTRIKIDDFDYVFGKKTSSNIWAGRNGSLKHQPIPGRKGWTSTMEFSREKILVKQHVEVVPGQSGYLDTLLVWYTVENKDDGKHKVGVRVMLDTFIGANDGVPFTIPGKKGFVDTKAEFLQKQIPDYIEVVEKPDDPKDPGTVARMGLHLKLPGGIQLEDMDKLRICRFPGATAPWEPDVVESMRPDQPGEKADSCVFLYWPYENMNPNDIRHMAFTYGLGSLEIGEGGGGGGVSLALSVPASVQPDHDFVATAYVWKAKKGDKVKLEVPRGLKLADGESVEKTIEEGGARSQVFWHVRSGRTGEYTLKATSGSAKSKPKQVVVKTTSIFG